MMRLDFRKMPPIGKVTINCRAMAANIPFDRQMDNVESQHYGHFKVTVQYVVVVVVVVATTNVKKQS